MRTKHKCIVLPIEDKIGICERLDKGSSNREITNEYDIGKSTISELFL